MFWSSQVAPMSDLYAGGRSSTEKTANAKSIVYKAITCFQRTDNVFQSTSTAWKPSTNSLRAMSASSTRPMNMVSCTWEHVPNVSLICSDSDDDEFQPFSIIVKGKTSKNPGQVGEGQNSQSTCWQHVSHTSRTWINSSKPSKTSSATSVPIFCFPAASARSLEITRVCLTNMFRSAC